MRDADPLGRTGRAGGVHNAVEAGAFGRHRIDRVILAHLSQLLECHNLELGVGLLELFYLIPSREYAALVDNDGLDVRLLKGSGSNLEEMRVDVHSVGLSLEEGVFKAALAECIVGGDYRDRLGGATVGHRDPAYAKEIVSATRRGLTTGETYLVVPKR